MSLAPYPMLRLKITPPPALQLKFVPAVPGWNASAAVAAIAVKVTGPDPGFSTDNAIVRWDGASGRLVQNSNAILLDAGDLAVEGRISTPAVNEEWVALVDGGTVPLNAAAGNLFVLNALGNRTILAPTNAPATGLTQKMIIRHQASGGPRTLSLETGSTGSFRFGTTITGLTATASGKIDYIGAIWNESAGFWDVVAYSKGY